MALAIALHLLSAIIWVGGMFFAYMILRPAAVEALQPPQRLSLWVGVFNRFFPWVWGAVGLLLASGLWMITVFYGGMGAVHWHVHAMLTVGLIMMLVFFHVYFAPFQRLKRAVAEQNWPEGGNQLGQIRKLIGFNLILGLLVAVIATAGRFL
ncbi:MAG TPA: CopD family protein [Pseudomonadales bacterium]|nr:CopD family protein [Pseudomonadales bacterium]